MMRFIKRIWNDIRQGENLDLYLTVLAAIILAILNLVGFALSSVINSFSLAILALLAVAMLGNRYRLDKLLESSQLGIDQILHQELTDKQDEINHKMEHAFDLLLIGTNLYSTIQRHYLLLENRLRAGRQVRILLVNPTGSASEFAAKRLYRSVSPEQYASQIKSSLQTLSTLKKETAGNLKLHVIDHPIGLGGVFTDMDTPEGQLFVWHHSYKSKEVARPKLVLQKSDGYWFEFYCDEARALWQDSAEWQAE